MKKIVALTAALTFLTASASFAAEEAPAGAVAPAAQQTVEKAPMKKAEHHYKKHHHAKKLEATKAEKKVETPAAEAPAAE